MWQPNISVPVKNLQPNRRFNPTIFLFLILFGTNRNFRLYTLYCALMTKRSGVKDSYLFRHINTSRRLRDVGMMCRIKICNISGKKNVLAHSVSNSTVRKSLGTRTHITYRTLLSVTSSNPWTGDGIILFKPFLLVNHKNPFIPALKQTDNRSSHYRNQWVTI